MPRFGRCQKSELMSAEKVKRGTDDDVQESLALDIKWDVLDNDGGGYNLVVEGLAGKACHVERRTHVRERRGASTRREVRVVGGRKRAVVAEKGGVFEPLLLKMRGLIHDLLSSSTIKRKMAHRREAATSRLVLQGRLTHAERVVLGLACDSRGSLKMILRSTVTAAAAVVIVSIV